MTDHQASADDPGPINPRLAAVFLEEATGRVEEMRASLDGDGDTERLARHAHSIASGAHHFPDTGLVDAARRIEQLANDGDIGGVRALFEAFEHAWSILRPQLETAAQG